MAEDGAKMSKSIGNVVDPLPVIEKYGSDALRMGIISARSAAVNRGYDQRKVEDARNFCNKLWNIARYIEDSIGDNPSREGAGAATPADHWILSKLQQSQEKVGSDLDNYRFSEAYETLYHFIWDDLADWYIEASKAEPNKPLLAYLLETVLTLAHPFAPFLTETIWQTLAWEADSILATRVLQKVLDSDAKQAANFAEIQTIVTEARFITKALKVSGATLYYTDVPFLRDNATSIKRLARLQAVSEVRDGNGLRLTSTRYACWLDIDKDAAQAYLKELAGKRAKQEALIKQFEARLANKNYVQNAPDRVVDQTKQQLADAKELLEAIENESERFQV
jgi:valyl-tRNA synthetase